LSEQDQAVAAPRLNINWPFLGLVGAMVVTLLWMGLLGYGLFKLLGPALF
jgi:hypothetical protein